MLLSINPQPRQDCLTVPAADSLETILLTSLTNWMWTESHPFSPAAMVTLQTGEFLIAGEIDIICCYFIYFYVD